MDKTKILSFVIEELKNRPPISEWTDEKHIDFVMDVIEYGMEVTYIVDQIEESLFIGYSYLDDLTPHTDFLLNLSEALATVYGHQVEISIFTNPINFGGH